MSRERYLKQQRKVQEMPTQQRKLSFSTNNRHTNNNIDADETTSTQAQAQQHQQHRPSIIQHQTVSENDDQQTHIQHHHQHHSEMMMTTTAQTPPAPRALSDPQFLFYVSASHGPALRATEVFVTKELFFRFFIESGVASAVSSYANKKTSGTSKKEKQQEGDEDQEILEAW